MLRRIFAPRPEKATARTLYDAIVRAARQPDLYGDKGVPDTLDGRFELVVLHTALVIIELKNAGDELAGAVSQSLFDTMFDDFDAAMRELGVGDSGVGKKIRFMAEGFYGRAKGLDEVMRADDDSAGLQDFLSRNVLASDSVDARAERLAVYVNSAHAALAAQGGDALAAGAPPAFPAA